MLASLAFMAVALNSHREDLLLNYQSLIFESIRLCNRELLTDSQAVP